MPISRSFTVALALIATELMQPTANAQQELQPDDSAVESVPAEIGNGSEDRLSSTDSDQPSLDDLYSEIGMLFEEFDIVVTAGRTAQSSNLTGVPVSVILADEIHASGVRSVPMLLEFIPGVDVTQIDRNRFAVGIRGLHHEFADRTLVLLDGRNAGSGLFGGVDFQRLPTFIEDLERIEVVRGPGGAVWGANAFQGVINLISKDPRETQGTLLSTQINEFGDVYTHARWGASKGDLAWRISAGWDDQESSSDAISGSQAGSRDFSRTLRLAADSVYTVDDTSEVQFGIGHTHIERGDFSFLNVQPRENEKLDYTRLYASYDSQLDNNTDLNLDLYTTIEDVKRPSFWEYGVIDTQLDGQIHRTFDNGHSLSAGMSLRAVRIETDPSRSDMTLKKNTFNEQWAGAYIAETWQATDRLTIEAQGRVDWYSEVTWDWSGRIAALYSLDPESKHVLRIAGAKAFRAPQTGLREFETLRVPLPSPPFPADTFGAEIVRAGDLDNEQVFSLEAGYFGLITDGVTFRTDGYYHFYRQLTGARSLPDPLGADRIIAEFDNLGGAEAWGIESEVTLEGESGRVSMWYAYQEFWFTYNTDEPDSRAFSSPGHRVGLRGTLDLNERARLSTNYRYSNTSSSDNFGTGGVREFHRVDVSFAYDFLPGRGEIAIGVRDLFDETDIAVEAVGSPGSAFKTPGQTLWVRVQLKF